MLNEHNPPPLDSVLVWISHTIEQDHEARGVFPGLRMSSACAQRGALALHIVPPAEAGVLLDDARARYKAVRAGLRTAYGALIRSVTSAVDESQERSAVAKDGAALVSSWRGKGWLGTTDGLQRAGIVLSGSWPEPGSHGRWRGLGMDGDARRVRVYRYDQLWPQLFFAYVLPAPLPPADMAVSDDARRKADAARRAIADMPQSPEMFVWESVATLRSAVIQGLVANLLEPSPHHGYSLDPTCQEDIHAGFDAFVEALAAARVNFDAARHAAVLQQHRAKIAAADEPFKGHLARMTQPELSGERQ